MRYGSVCSGIEAATVAWHPLGWEPVFFSEIEKFPSAVLAHHYPHVPNYGDMTRFSEWPDAALDVLVGGTPCQSFSVAGLRKGLADPRGNLMLTYLAIADRYRPRWLVWENVPGVLSSNGGKDFGALLGGLGELGYGWAYRVLDAQYFGVAQRRRRVFVVGHLGDWRAAAAVLFERHSLQGNPAPSRKAGKGNAAAAQAGSGEGCRVASVVAPETAKCLLSRANDPHREDIHTYIAHTLRAQHDASEDGTGRGTPLVPVAQPIAIHPRAVGREDAGPEGKDWRDGGTSFTMDTSGAGSVVVPQAMAFPWQSALDPIGTPEDISGTLIKNQTMAVAQPIAFEPGVMSRVGGHVYDDISGTLCKEPGDNKMAVAQPIYFGMDGDVPKGDVSETISTREGAVTDTAHAVAQAMAVRRLTPRECERLQGFPDDFTAIPYRGKTAADGPRYKALGNSMAVPCMAWIGRRLQAVEDILNGKNA